MTDPQKSKCQPIQVEMEGSKICMILPTMEDNILMGIKWRNKVSTRVGVESSKSYSVLVDPIQVQRSNEGFK